MYLTTPNYFILPNQPISVEPFDIATQDDPAYPPSSITSTSPLVVVNFIITLPTPPPPQDHDDDDDDDDYLYMPTLAVATTVLRGPTRSRDDSDSDADAEDDRWRNETSSDIELGVRKTEGGRRERVSTAAQRAEVRRPEQVAPVFRRRNVGAEEDDGVERAGWLPQLGGRIARLREVVRR
ncbi:hypothetical protein BC937DRAFT_93684 [Endogone sp. FLAS-F59071]|nr:hypothetical protein BC937DRAFT_93684 [Endogone sp. FLAS-F59071]|eukprot:RUS14520.1 hypothetical protein BC937DRAFT_93684 [Endogone sp. FLAS-F59071]